MYVCIKKFLNNVYVVRVYVNRKIDSKIIIFG